MTRQGVRLGFRAFGPVHLCQDIAVLERFTEFTYDLDDAAFVAYFQARCGLQIRSCGCCLPGYRWQGWPEGTAQLWPCPAGCWERRKAEMDRASVPRDRVERIRKGQLQDAWEIYLGGLPVSAVPAERASLVIDPGFGREAVPVEIQMSLF